MLYLLLEIDPGDISPYDLTWDQRIVNEVSEIGAKYPIKIMIVRPGPETIAMFDNQQPVEPSASIRCPVCGTEDWDFFENNTAVCYNRHKFPVSVPDDSVTLHDAGFGGQDITYEKDNS